MRNIDLIPVHDSQTPFLLPLFSCSVSAGFPSPASDYADELFDLNRLLLRHPDATYLVRVSGESMKNAEIHEGDLLAVDKQLEADHNHIVVAVVDGRVHRQAPGLRARHLVAQARKPRLRALANSRRRRRPNLGRGDPRAARADSRQTGGPAAHPRLAMYALVDCNNFYVSCERVFQPRLDGRPVVVLCNNDGCIDLAQRRSQGPGPADGRALLSGQAPAGAAPRGRVFQQLRALRRHVAPGDVVPEPGGARRGNLLHRRGLSGSARHGALRGRAAWTPTPAACAPTCWPAPASRPAWALRPPKRWPSWPTAWPRKTPTWAGCCYLDTAERRRWALEQVAVEDVWGIGRQYATKLHAAGHHHRGRAGRLLRGLCPPAPGRGGRAPGWCASCRAFPARAWPRARTARWRGAACAARARSAGR